MKIVCPSCAADYRMSQDKIPEDGLLIRCPSCQHSFRAYGNGTTASVSDDTSPAARGPDEKSIAPPPPPPLDLGDEFDKFGDFDSIEFDESVSEISESGGSIDQSGNTDVEAYGLSPPPPPPPPPGGRGKNGGWGGVGGFDI
ncbi:MAG: zinc-ribbon domain-containing protein [Myxococcota bacterium]|nr:zinc-ribbon domain-containing protein [Myxococcota bacterium]